MRLRSNRSSSVCNAPRWQRRSSHALYRHGLTAARYKDVEVDEVSAPSAKPSFVKRMLQVVQPFHDEKANNRFVALSLGGMLCSIATLIHDSYLPVFMRDELGMTNTRIGSVQAMSQLLCQFSKSFSGVLGDILGSQVKILVFGTALTVACKPIFALSSIVFTSFGAAAALWAITVGKLMDRVSKGFREAPTKALISRTAVQVQETSDAAFSVRQSLATVGSLVGSAIASAAFLMSGQSYVTTFALATVPPLMALVWLMFVFRDDLTTKTVKPAPEGDGAIPLDTARRRAGAPSSSPPPSSENGTRDAAYELDAMRQPELSWLDKALALVRAFRPAYWQALLVVSVLYFGRFDFAWVTLRAKACAVPKALLPILGSTTMLATTFTALSVGQFAKGKGVAVRNRILLVGFSMLLLANTALAAPFSANVPGMFASCALIGLHMGMTHGLTLSMVSSYMPHDELPGLGKVTGTAWSFTDAILGCILALSNSLAGRLTDWTVNNSMGNVGCFAGGAAASVAAAILLLIFVHFGALGKDLTVASKTSRS